MYDMYDLAGTELQESKSQGLLGRALWFDNIAALLFAEAPPVLKSLA